MQKLRGVLMILGLMTIIGTCGVAYRMWSANAIRSNAYDLYLAGRFPGSTITKEVMEAKVATQKAKLLAVAGGTAGLTLLVLAWVQPRKRAELHQLEEVKV